MKKYAKTPTVLQLETTECGAASLAMILGYYGRYMTLEQLRIETAVGRDGVKASNLKRAAIRLGLECKAYHRELEQLREVPVPCILFWNMNHYVVFEGFKGKYGVINDPAAGRRKVTMEELDDSFSGVVLTFRKGEGFQKSKKQDDTLPFILKRVKRQTPVLLKLVYIGLLLVFPGLVLPVLSQVFVDDILLAGYTNWLTRLLVFMGGCLLLKEGLTLYRSLILQKLKSKMSLISGYRLLSHMFSLPIAFFSQRSVGELASRMSNNDEIDDFLAGDLAESVLSILTVLFYLAVLFFYSAELTLIGLASVAVSLLVMALSNRVIANATLKLQMSAGNLMGSLASGINITDTIKASGVEAEYSGRLMGYQAVYATQEQKMSRFRQVVQAIPQATNRIANVLILMVGAMLVIRGDFTVGMLVGFNALFDSFVAPVNELIGFFDRLQKLKSNVNRVSDIERYPADVKPQEDAGARLDHKLSGMVDLEDVSFGYAVGQPPVVSGFHFHLNSGESIAFVGPSGCGKSTISKIVSGLYRPWAGQVRFDGMALEQIPASVRHASIATVSQSITLFSGTVRENLTMWNRAISESDMMAAARDACIDDLIESLPGGYDYMLTENAANLSGGQRQRMEIARALAGNPSILVMDEATSALDPIVEKRIMDNIQRRGCTCVIVAHRLSAIRDCNQIVVMYNGQIIQRGTHASLSREDGFYRSFYQEA